MQQEPKETQKDELEVSLRFLNLTKEGEYAEIDPYSLDYLRIKELREEPYEDVIHHYSYR